MKRIFTILVALLLVFQANAQRKVDYNHSKWFFGLNLGKTWHTTDVRNKLDNGFGFTLGKSYNYDYGRAISFDLRFRYFYGRYYGQSFSPTIDLSKNPLYGPFASNVGFSVLNFKTTVSATDLELVLHANRFRERTGWDLSIFGGVGFTFANTYANFYKGDALPNNLYAYDSLPKIDKSSITSLVDKDYETSLSGGVKVYFAPSLGFGIGRQLGKRVYLGVEHKTTFTRNDSFDGFSAAVGNDNKNDLYHYTSGYLRWYFKTRVYNDPEIPNPNPNPNPNPGNGNGQGGNGNLRLPIVNFINPSSSGTTVNRPDYIIKANVLNVSDRQNIVFKQNGNYVQAFAFNNTTGRLESSVYLVTGQNIFEIVASNNDGTDQESTIIIYNPQQNQVAPPRVDITNPAVSPTTVNSPSYNFAANVFNVNSQNEITYTVNGVVTVFNWNVNTNQLTSTINLNPGSNVVTVSASNVAGSDSETATIIYNREEQQVRPTVVFTDPSTNPYNTNIVTHAITANVFNVASQQNIIFKQNGQVTTNFTYNATTHVLAILVSLNSGQNIFEIIASNNAGSATASTIINYTNGVRKPPVVTITNPAFSPTTVDNVNFTFAATVLNVTMSNQIVMSLNGQNITNFNYNANTNGVTANLNLIQGTNTVVITGTNADGTDSKQTTIIVRPTQVAQPPVVTYINPSNTPTTVENPSYSVMANISNLTMASQVNVNINGLNFTNFNFNTSSNTLTFPLNLIEGVNVIVVTGTNSVGVDSETTTIIYRKPTQQVQPPVVNFIMPVSSPTDSYTQNYNLTARVKYVASASNIVLKINGVTTTNFTYVASSEMMNFSSALIAGANVFEITATNSAGQAVESTTIIYRQTVQTLAPTVTLVAPAFCPANVSVSTYAVQAIVMNVANANEISITLNGTPVTNFIYNANTHQVSFTANLVSGSNAISITATNNGGTASASCSIVYKPIEIVKPIVTFINPAVSGTTVATPGFIMKAKVLNVDSKSQITVVKDGATLNQVDFSYNATAKEITYNTNLIQGNNIFVVTGTNNGGTSSASSTILYKIADAPCSKPSVSILTPASTNLEVSVNTLAITATASNLTAANQIEVSLNGVVLTSGVSFNLATGTIALTVNLNEGQNIIEFTAKNACGSAKAIVKVTYKKIVTPCYNPSITRVLPLTNVNVENANFAYKAIVTNVMEASQLTLTVNNVVVQSILDIASGALTATLTLTNGNNDVKLQASNTCGSVSNTVTVNYRACVTPTLSLSSSPQGRITKETAIAITGNIGGTSANAQITVTLNGRPINFIYNDATHIITVTNGLAVGTNTFVITVNTPCGTVTESLTIERENVVQILAPTVVIINPAQSGTETEQSSYLVKAITSNIDAQNQISVTVNGNQSNFNFEPSQNALTLTANLQEGNNVVTITVSNAAGNSSDAKSIIYKKEQEDRQVRPYITFTNPTQNQTTVNSGVHYITGTAFNVTSISQVEITVNGSVLNSFSPVFSNNQMTFNFPVSLDRSNPVVTVIVRATNTVGTSSEVRILNVNLIEKPADSKPNGERPTNGGGSTEPKPGGGKIAPKPSGGRPTGGTVEPKPTGGARGAGKVEATPTPPAKPAEVPITPTVKGKRGGLE
jgi:large repetitive protein